MTPDTPYAMSGSAVLLRLNGLFTPLLITRNNVHVMNTFPADHGKGIFKTACRLSIMRTCNPMLRVT